MTIQMQTEQLKEYNSKLWVEQTTRSSIEVLGIEDYIKWYNEQLDFVQYD